MTRRCAYRYCHAKMAARPASHDYCSKSCRHKAERIGWEIRPGQSCLYCREGVIGRSGNVTCNGDACRRSNAAWNMAFQSTDGQIDRVYLPAVAEKTGGLCEECGDVLSAPFDLDHIVPRQYGGDHTVENLHFLHKQCHVEKTVRDAVAA